LEPEPTQHNVMDRLQTRKQKSTTLLLMVVATKNSIQPACCLPTNSHCLLQVDSLARHLLRLAYNTNIRAMDRTDKTY